MYFWPDKQAIAAILYEEKSTARKL